MEEIVESAGQAVLYGLVGFAVMAVAFVALDLVTPGHLFKVVWSERNKGAAVVLGSEMAGVGWIVAEAIRASESEAGLDYGLLSTGLYGLAGVVVMTLVFLVVGAITPGPMGARVLEDQDGRPHPAAWVQGAVYLGTALMVGAALS
ncbi:DUF350 domain-containing protein [Streptomyces radicis]|uniref:DUF350 domain-containing protein n=1 Tax=Streptomyces radicis TaxID=1750517 RepID=A0A3A9WGR6_9ACTN|nr:DUF350 domain-containing protein [Streptomyces sp. PT12]RKN12228.1 DUF350 domain-containing protein [Streptomyces radicis]RKN26096.1 DUF350 domain-containing protein [Streptomyces radicis]